MAEDFFPSFGSPAPAQAPPATSAPPPVAATTDFFPSFTTTQAPPQEPHRATKDELFPPPTAELDYTPNYEPYKRIFQAGVEGAEGVPHIPRVPGDYVTAPFYNPVIAGAETALRAGGALLRGGQQAVVEATPDIHLGSLNVPWLGISGELTPGSLGREIAALPEAFPTGAAELRPPMRPAIPEAPPPAPRTIQELTAPSRPAGMTDLERMHQLIQHDTAPPPPIPTPEATAKPTFYGRDWMRNAGETGTGFDMTKGGNAMSGAAQQALDAGHKVELVADGGNKTVPIVGVKNGMMVDDKGQQWGGVPVAFDGTGREGLRITPSATPKGPEPWETAPEYGPQPAPAQSQTTGGGARTAADAKDVAKTHYDYADSVGGTLTPQFTNKFIDSVAAAAPQTEAGAAVSGKSAVADLTERLQSLRGKPMTLQAVQEVDEGLSGLIDKEYGTKGLSKEGKHLLDVQADFRNMIEDAGAGDITGDASGFDALKSGRQAWSQARKMDDVERMWQRANGTDNPTTDFRRQVRVLLDNRARSRGYTATEKASLWDAASRGVIGGTLHVFGSRLIPWAAGIAETKSGGLGSGLLAAGVAHAGTTAIRGAGNWLQQRRINRTMEGLGASVPPPAPPLP